MLADSGPSTIWIRVCAWCGINLPGDEVTPEPAGSIPRITHGICPDCCDKLIRTTAAERATIRPAGLSPGGVR